MFLLPLEGFSIVERAWSSLHQTHSTPNSSILSNSTSEQMPSVVEFETNPLQFMRRKLERGGFEPGSDNL